tara:strand:- start:104 stop:862 length:759 start_codon:yes stop_codon:yes gene_type:complete
MHGHYSIRLVKSNSCYACMAIRQEKNSDYNSIYYKNNREKINNLVNARRADPNDDFQKREKERTKKYRERNSTEVKKRGREKANKRYWNDPEKARAYARENAKLDHNKTARNERLKNKRLNDPTFIVVERARTRIRGVFRRRMIPKKGSTKELLGLNDWNDLSKFIEDNFLHGMNWGNQDQWDIDHLRPCSTFEFDNDNEQLKVCFNWRNLRPLWKRDNEYKSDNYDKEDEIIWIERMRSLGYEGELYLKFK